MKTTVLIGCSSYYNKLWKGFFYPDDLPSSKWFEYYCRYFDTFEINATFYKFPTKRILKNWYDKTPTHFTLSVKIPKEITHIKKLTSCETLISDFYTLCHENLKEKLGCVLFQFPPSYKFSLENLERIIQCLNTNYKNVIEFRHDSWWNTTVYDEFLKNNISFCSISHPKIPDTLFTQFPQIYLRLHGTSNMFYSSYSSIELRKIKEIAFNKNAFIYFNNTASTAGIENALLLKKWIQH